MQDENDLQKRIFAYNSNPALQQGWIVNQGFAMTGFPGDLAKAYERRKHDRAELADETFQGKR